LLDLLAALYGEFWIPDAVHAEYQRGRTRHPGSPDLDTLTWLRRHSVVPHSAVPTTLDAGEAEALELALNSSARLILLDERRARQVASSLGLTVAGSLTVLVEAKKRGLITHVGPVIEQMIAQGRRISVQLKAHVLQLAGEQVSRIESARELRAG